MQERDMRERVQKKRGVALERARREDMVMRLHEDRKIRQEVMGSRFGKHNRYRSVTTMRRHGQ